MRESIVCALALVLPLALAGCSVFGEDRPGVAKVEDLVGRVERVHVEVELSRDSAAAAVRALESIAGPGFTGDRVEAFRALKTAGEASRVRASALREAAASMRLAAEPVFEQWRIHLDGIASASVRARSADRLRATRERYDAIAQSMTPAVEDFDALNRSINDLTLFLDHDFNPTAVDAIHDDLTVLDRDQENLAVRFEHCLTAAQAYLALVAPADSDDAAAKPVR